MSIRTVAGSGSRIGPIGMVLTAKTLAKVWDSRDDDGSIIGCEFGHLQVPPPASSINRVSRLTRGRYRGRKSAATPARLIQTSVRPNFIAFPTQTLCIREFKANEVQRTASSRQTTFVGLRWDPDLNARRLAVQDTDTGCRASRRSPCFSNADGSPCPSHDGNLAKTQYELHERAPSSSNLSCDRWLRRVNSIMESRF